MESILFAGLSVGDGSLTLEGTHTPGSLTRCSGVWISAAGTAMLEPGTWTLKAHEQFIWLAIETGSVTVKTVGGSTELKERDFSFLPASDMETSISCDTMVSCLWFAVDGPLAAMFVRKMGALIHTPLRQTAYPSQLYLGRQIAQVMVRHSGTGDATYQLQHLMYGMLSSQWGQPVAMDAMLSHEIAKVVDTLRANDYRDNLSLAEMAEISRMPQEAFRKRFVSELGMPPLSYVQRCKMERAKELLRDEHYSVQLAGAAVGMKDPCHFSKQFKNIVGVSPSTFAKQAARPGTSVHRKRRTKKEKEEEEA